MSDPGNKPIEIVIPPPQPDAEAIRANQRLDDLLLQIQTANEENRQWTISQLETCLSRLENLEATSVTGLQNLSQNLAETKDFLTLKLAELQAARNQPETLSPEIIPEPPEQAPPQTPPVVEVDLPAPQNPPTRSKPQKNRRVL